MKTPELDVSNRYTNGYCGCPLCVGKKPEETNNYEIIEKTFNDSIIFFKNKLYKDDRGYFQETWNDKKFKEEIINCNFVQDNTSVSSKNVFRGMHFQYPYHPQAKLVSCQSGYVIDFVMDIRKDSPYYGVIRGYILNDPSLFLFISAGFAHGFYACETSTFRYKCSDYRYPAEEYGISLAETLGACDSITCINQNKELSSFHTDVLNNATMSMKDSNAYSLNDLMKILRSKYEQKS